jgi:predicted permease
MGWSRFFRRAEWDKERAKELESHLAHERDHYLACGLLPDDARRAAHRKLGNTTRIREDIYTMNTIPLVETFWHDLRYGVRMLRKRQGFTVVAVLSLAIGIGANTVIFSLVNAFILQETAFDRPEELVSIYSATADTRYSTLSYPDFEELRDGTGDVFSGIGVSIFALARVEFGDGVASVVGEAVTGDYFPLLGIEASLGRVIGPSDDLAPGAHPVVMLGHGYWLRAFGADKDIAGRELRLGGRTYTVIGVAPDTYQGSFRGVQADLFVPMTMYDELMGVPMRDQRGSHNLVGVARLAPGATLVQAETAVAGVAASLDAARLDGWGVGDSFSLIPTGDVLIFPSMDPYIRAIAWLLMVVVGLVLLLACTNLASFLLARARDRRREIAVRLALGATRGALVRQFLTETTLLSALGGLAGLGLATWLLRALEVADFPLPFALQLTLDLSPDSRVLAFTLGVSVLAGALLGLLPALQSTRPDVASTLKQETAGGGQPGQLRWRNALIVTQLTVSLVLLVGAGLFLRSFQQLNAIDPGFGRVDAGMMTVMVPNTRFTTDEGQRYVGRLLDRMQNLPGMEAVGVISNMPLDIMSNGLAFNVDGHAPPRDKESYRAERASVDPTLFEAATIPIVRGRNFRETDDGNSSAVGIVSEAMAQRFWPDGDAVGRVIRQPDEADLRVVGIAADIKVDSLSESPAWHVYLPYTQTQNFMMHFVARTSLDADQAALAMATAGRALDPEMMVWGTSTMNRHLAVIRLPAQLGAFVLSVFAVLALALAVIGLYGVVSYSVASRTREVGIRMALGANASAITRQLAGDGVRLVLIASVVGLALALLVSRLLGNLLVGSQTTDLAAFLGAPLVLCATALLASYLPARRASRADPVAGRRAA